MKFNIFFLFCFFLLNQNFGVVGSGGNVSGLTKFTDIPEFLAGGPIRIDMMPNLSINDEGIKKRVGFEAVYNYSNSSNDDKIAQFFLPHRDLLLTATGGPDYFENSAVNKEVRDLDSAILNITDPSFFSISEIFPKSTVSYLGFFTYYNFLFNDDNTPKLSLQLAFPCIKVMRKIIGNETIYKKGPEYDNSPIKSVLEGLSRKELLAQKWNFSEAGMSQTKFSNVEINLSYNYLPMKQCSVESYFGALVPINNSKKNKITDSLYVFNPTIQNSQHFGFQYGSTISLFLYQNDERLVKFTLGNNLLYFLPNTLFRTFDLDGRPWSRYLFAYKNFQLSDQVKEPLANFLTFECRVSPNFSNISTIELAYMKDFYNFNIGYSLFSRQSESITILEDLPNVVLVGSNSNMTSIPPLSLVRTAALRLELEDIECTEPVYNDLNYYYAKIDNTMIDIASATHPAVFIGELYLKMGLNLIENSKIIIGSSYRFCHNNTGIDYITGWGGIELFF